MPTKGRRHSEVRYSNRRVWSALLIGHYSDLLQTGALPGRAAPLPWPPRQPGIFQKRVREVTMNFCPVCGYRLPFAPADHHICPSCGTEFGYDDSGVSHEQLRERWMRSGPKWWSPVDARPSNWDPREQMLLGIFSRPRENPTRELLSYATPLSGFKSRLGTKRGRRRRKGRIKFEESPYNSCWAIAS